MKKILGLDIGITSVGWGIIDENQKIIDAGVRLFDEADTQNNVKRREFRGTRRIIRRRRQRIVDMKELLIKYKIISKDFLASKNPYELRLKGLTKKLSNEELATILLHYAKKRGSSLETVGEGKDEQSTKTVLSNNEILLQREKFVINVQLNRLKENGKLKGHQNVFRTEDYLIEIKAILENQHLDKLLEDEIIHIISRRRHYSHGPGNLHSPSPYGRFRKIEGVELEKVIEFINEIHHDIYKKKSFNIKVDEKEYRVFKNGTIVNNNPYDLIALMRGKCSLFPEKLRAPKMSFSAELFNLLNDLNNLKINNRENNKITEDEKKEVIDKVRNTGNITVNNLLKILDSDLEDVSGFRQSSKGLPILTEFKGYKKILKVYKDLKLKIDDDKTIDKVVEILTETVVYEERYNKIKDVLKNNKLIEEISNLTGISQYHNLSFEAIYLLNNELMNSTLNQQQIITEQNLKDDSDILSLALNEEAILSPVARRAHRESLKLIKELMKIHGGFERIIIETTREKNSADARKLERERQSYFEKSKKEAIETIGEYSPENVNASNIIKLRLLKEQDSKCAYTGIPIDIGLLLRDSKAYEVDHIIPLSISLDNSLNNRVLVTHSANQIKGNKTPFGFFSSGKIVANSNIKNWDEFEAIVRNNKNYSIHKKRNLLFLEDINKYSVRQDFINRNLVDTSYAIKTIMTTLKDYFKANNIDTKVLTIKGKQTNMFRGIGSNLIRVKYNIKNEENIFIKNRDIYLHHAVDALIIAGLSNVKNIKQMYNLVVDKELEQTYDFKTGEVISFDKDSLMHKYLLDIDNYISENAVKYTWKIDSKPNRKISDQTIYSTRMYNGDHYVIKKINNIYEEENKKLEKMLVDEKNNLLVYKHDIKTYDIIYKAYTQYKHEKYPLKTFRENHGPLRKYSKKQNGPIITSLKYSEDKLGRHMDITPTSSINKKVVKLQLSPYRTDFYYSDKDKQYKFLTIRYGDLKPMKNRFIIEEDKYEELKKLKKITSDYKFMFSLTRNNIIKISKQEKDKKVIDTYRFIATNNDIKNTIEVKPINYYEGKQLMLTIGKKISDITKYNVSVSGITNIFENETLKMII